MYRKILAIAFISSLALALTAYSNGSFLSAIVGEQSVGIIFTISSILTLVGIEFLPQMVARFGNKYIGIALISIGMVSTGMLAISTNHIVELITFVLFTASITLLPFVYDVFLEHSTDKSHVGDVRGTFLMLTNFAWLCSPFFAGTIIEKFGFSTLFGIASIVLMCTLLLMFVYIKKFEDVAYERISLITSIHNLFQTKDIRNSIGLALLLQTFYGVMVVFMPVYLHTHIGFDFKTTGILFTIMLLPFILISVPAGKLADKKIGEKELMILGIIIASLATIATGIYTKNNVYIWGILLLGTRIGAALMEAMIDTFFFKKIEEKDTAYVSLYRGMSPLGYLIGPLLGTVCVFLGSPAYAFIFLGIIMSLLGISWAYSLHDTK
jgi:MFS family permease